MLRMRNLRWKILVSAAVLLIGLQSSAVAAVDPGEYVVGEIRIEGNKLISTDEILGVMKTHNGDKFSREAVMEDLKAINDLGFFDGRKLEVNPIVVDGKVQLSIKVEENTVLKSFSVRGNKEIYEAELLEPFLDQVGMPQNANKLSKAISKVESNYHDRGYVLAKVKDVVDCPDGNVELIVDEGIIDRLEISGEPKSLHGQIAIGLSFASGCVYNEKLLATELRILYANGKFDDFSRSLIPSDRNKDRYILKIGFEPASKKISPKGDISKNQTPLKLSPISMSVNRHVDSPVNTWMEELFEDPRYGLELIRRKCSPEEAFGKSIALTSDERKLIKRTIHYEWNRAKVSGIDLPPVYQTSRVRWMIGVRGYRAYANLASAYKIKPSCLDSAAHMRTLLNPYGTKVPILKLHCPSVAINGLDPNRVLTTPLLTAPLIKGSEFVVK